MIRFIIHLSVAILITSMDLSFATAQNYDWLWAQSAGGASSDAGQAIATDPDGNILVTGNFNSDTITFGSIILTNAGGFDGFLVKYDGAGSVLWAVSIGGPSDEKGESVCTDVDGNVYLAGNFSSPLITIGGATLVSADSTDAFVVKFDPDGNVVWAKSAGGNNHDYARSARVDFAGNVYLAGYFKSSSLIAGSYTLSNSDSGYYDIFLIKYDSLGNELWMNGAAGNFSDRAYSMSCDLLGNLYLTGYYYSSAMYFGDDTIVNSGMLDFFLACYHADGSLAWVTSGGGEGDERALCSAVDTAGNIYIAGSFTSPVLNLGDFTLVNADSTDLFIIKYHSDGSLGWAVSAGGNDHDAASDITMGKTDGSLYLTGYFRSPSIAFGSHLLNNSNTGYADLFVAAYDFSGNAKWAIKADGASSDYGEGITTDIPGNVFVTGRFFSPTLSFGNHQLIKVAWEDMFLAKYGPWYEGTGELTADISNRVYPNPVVNSAHISYELTQREMVEIKLYDESGREVAVLCRNTQLPGSHEVNFEGMNLKSGIYYYRILAGKTAGLGKIVVTH